MECQGRVSNVAFLVNFLLVAEFLSQQIRTNPFIGSRILPEDVFHSPVFLLDGESQKFASSILGRKKSFGL